MSVDKPSTRISTNDTVYLTGGRGNPKLIGWTNGSIDENEDFFGLRGRQYYKEVERYSPQPYTLTNEPKVLGKPRTVVRHGKWIGYKLKKMLA